MFPEILVVFSDLNDALSKLSILSRLKDLVAYFRYRSTDLGRIIHIGQSDY